MSKSANEVELANDLYDWIWGNDANVGTPLDTEFSALLLREFSSIVIKSKELGEFVIKVEAL